MKNIGVFILIIGLIMTVYTGYSFITKEKVVDLGSIEIFRNEEHSAYWSPFIGIAVMIIGGALMTLGRKKSPA